MAGIDSDYQSLCQDLSLPEGVRKRAWGIWQDLDKLDETQIKTKAEWFLAVIYMAAVDSSMPYGPADPHADKQSCMCITVTDLLKASHTNVFTFLERLRSLRDTVSFSDAVRYHLARLERRYCIVYPLYDKFNREWKSVFREDEDKSAIRTDICLNPDRTEARKMLCWTLFLHAKDCLLQESQELIFAYHVLVCCIEYVVRTTPSFQLQEPYDMLKLKSTENLDQNGFNVAVLGKLADLFKTSLEELFSIQKNTESYFESLKNSGIELTFPTLRDLYHENYRERGDLDEIQFLDIDTHLLPKGIVLPNNPSNKDVLLTTVRTALNTIQRLKTILASSTDKPDSELSKYFQNCSSDPEPSISSRLSNCRCKFLEHYKNEQEGIAEQRYELSTRLYYRVMKQLLNMEKERLGVTDFSTLLNNDIFHRSLLACSVEIVLMTYSISWHPSRVASVPEDSRYSFPWILEVFDILPYDFYKVIESFIQAEPNLTREIIQHLTGIENKILDCIAWKSGSPLLELLPKNDSSAIMSPSKKQAISNGAELYVTAAGDQKTSGSPGSDLIYSKDAKDGVTASFTKDPQETKPGQKRSGPLLMFLNKVFRLGHQRLKSLCSLLLISEDVQQKIWTCFELCLTWRTDLMKNRHLDMILMCCIYGVCKVTDREIKFKDIVTAYRTLPFAEAHVYKSALIQGNEYDSIIIFYNRIFMQSMKNFILQFSKPSAQMNLSPVPRPVTSPLTASPVYSIPGRRNFLISPLRESPFKTPQSPSSMTPRSRQLYSFGEGPGSAEKLKHINDSMSAFKSKNVLRTTPQSLKRLNFDRPGSSESSEEDEAQITDGTTVIVIKKKKVDKPSKDTEPTSKET